MRTIMLIARGALTYAGRVIADGERFEAAAIDAAVLHYRRQAVFAPRVRPPAPVPGADVCTPARVVAPATDRPRRRYKRRDMEAED